MPLSLPHLRLALTLTASSPSSHFPFPRTIPHFSSSFHKNDLMLFSALLDTVQWRESVELREGGTTGPKLVWDLWHCGYMLCKLPSWAAERTAPLFTTGSLVLPGTDEGNPGKIPYPSLILPFKCIPIRTVIHEEKQMSSGSISKQQDKWDVGSLIISTVPFQVRLKQQIKYGHKTIHPSEI